MGRSFKTCALKFYLLIIVNSWQRTRSTKGHFWSCENSKCDWNKNDYIYWLLNVLLVIQICQTCVGKNLISDFINVIIALKNATTFKPLENDDFSPIFGNQLIEWFIKENMRHMLMITSLYYRVWWVGVVVVKKNRMI